MDMNCSLAMHIRSTSVDMNCSPFCENLPIRVPRHGFSQNFCGHELKPLYEILQIWHGWLAPRRAFVQRFWGQELEQFYEILRIRHGWLVGRQSIVESRPGGSEHTYRPLFERSDRLNGSGRQNLAQDGGRMESEENGL